MQESSYFDRRAETYDRDEVHHRVVSLLLASVDIQPGAQILDIATGTGILALQAARRVGPAGKIVGIDVSRGMLAEARRKAALDGQRNIDFLEADAEQLALPGGSFDLIFCASAIVFMSDIPRALRHWSGYLKPGGLIAFDAPARPFGLSERIADSAAAQGVHLAYAGIADTPGKCRSLLRAAGLETVVVRTELANSGPVAHGRAIAFWDGRLEHPAWRALRQAPMPVRETIRRDYVACVTAASVDGWVPNDTALNLVFGRKAA